MYTSGVWGFSSANEQKRSWNLENLGGDWLTSLQLFNSYILSQTRTTHYSSVPTLPVFPLVSFPTSFFFKKMIPLSHTFSILYITFHTLLSQVVLRSHRHVKPTTFGPWQLSLPSPSWTQPKVLNPQCGQRKLVELPAKGLLQMVWLLCRAQKEKRKHLPLTPHMIDGMNLATTIKYSGSIWRCITECTIYYFFIQSYLSWDYKVKFMYIIFWKLPEPTVWAIYTWSINERTHLADKKQEKKNMFQSFLGF